MTLSIISLVTPGMRLERLIEPLGALAEFGRRQDVDVPAGEPGGQADVLTALADGQGKLIFIDDDGCPAEFKAKRHFRHFGGLEGVADEHLAGFVPADDVDFFTAEFIDDVLDSASANADAGADGIHLGVDRADGDLGAVARLARQGLDFDRSLADFGNFALEEPADEFRMAAAQNDLDGAGRIANFQNQGLNALADLVDFAGNLLAARHDPLDVSQEGDDHGVLLEAGDGSGDDGADAVFVFLVDASAFVLADELDHDLLDGLGADAADDGERNLDALPLGADDAGDAIELDGEFAGVLGVELLAKPGGDGLLDVVVDLVALDIFVAGDSIHDSDQFLRIHDYSRTKFLKQKRPAKFGGPQRSRATFGARRTGRPSRWKTG